MPSLPGYIWPVIALAHGQAGGDAPALLDVKAVAAIRSLETELIKFNASTITFPIHKDTAR
ncbi:MAG: hypothetical protein AAFR23_05605 [Pseudomonadota bacterium]